MKILFVLSRFPAPARTGDRLRAIRQIEFLSQQHEVHLVCLSGAEPSATETTEVRSLVASLTVVPHGRGRIARNLVGVAFGDLPIQAQMYKSAELADAVRDLIRTASIDVVVTQLARMAPNVVSPNVALPNVALPNVDGTGVPQVLDFVDALSLGLERRAESSRWPMRWVLSHEARRMAKLEAKVGEAVVDRLVTSPVDAAHISAMGTGPIHVVPVGVSDDFFDYGERDVDGQYEYDLLFTGNLGYAPNVVACEFLVNEVLPKLTERLPDIKVALVGARPSRRVRKLASSHVEIHGPVPDLRPFFARSRAAIAPMLIGSGIQLKLLESMAMAVPTITTPLANAPLGAEPDRHVALGSDAAELADAAHKILTSPDGGYALGQQGQQFVSERYRWGRLNAEVEAILVTAVSPPQHG